MWRRRRGDSPGGKSFLDLPEELIGPGPIAEFRDHAYLPRPGVPIRYAVEQFPVRLLGLDTLVPGADGGALDAAQLEWLEAQLAAAPGRPTLIFLHHPPVKTGEVSCDSARESCS